MQKEITELRNQVQELRAMVDSLMDQISPDLIQAKRFEVVNDQKQVIVEMGQVRVEVDENEVDFGSFNTLNSKGETMVKLHAGPGGGFVTTENSKGQIVVQIGAGKQGAGFICTHNGNGQPMAMMGFSNSGGGHLETYNQKGQVLVSINVSDGGTGYVTVENGQGQKLVALTAGDIAGGVMMTYDHKSEITSITPDQEKLTEMTPEALVAAYQPERSITMENDNDLREQAISAMSNMEYGKAIPMFIDVLKVGDNVNNWELHYMIGQCYRFEGDIKNACISLQKAISDECGLRGSIKNGEVRPDQASPVFHAYGIASQLNEDYNAADFALKMAIQLNPYAFSSYNSLGITYRRQGMLTEALDCYNHAEKLINEIMIKESCSKAQELFPGDPTFALILNNRGLCKLDIQDIEGAKNDFILSINETPEGYSYPEPTDNLNNLVDTA